MIEGDSKRRDGARAGLSRLRRLPALAAVLGLVMIVSMLTGCTKPQPTITVLANNRSTTVPAQPTCTILASNPCTLEAGKRRIVKARGGSQLLIDVPRQLADNGYIVAAYVTSGTTNTPLTTPGAATGPISGQLSVRLTVPSQVSGSYFVQVNALPSKNPSKQLTSWLVLVELTS